MSKNDGFVLIVYCVSYFVLFVCGFITKNELNDSDFMWYNCYVLYFSIIYSIFNQFMTVYRCFDACNVSKCSKML